MYHWQLLAFLAFLYRLEGLSKQKDCNVTELSFVPVKVAAKTKSWSSSIELYSFPGYQRKPSRLFLDVQLQINLTDKDVKIYQGDNCSVVLQQYNDDRDILGLLLPFSVMRSKKLNPFDRTVVGVVTSEAYVVKVRVLEINYMRAGAFVSAILLYLLSYSLVRNALFFYSSGCAVGLIASLLIVGFTVYRFAPKKWIFGLPLLFGGWTFSFYSVYFLWKNFATVVLKYQKFVSAYFATVIIISFAVCYRYGPPTDIRSHNLAQWALQLIAILIIYFSSQIDEISYAVIALLIIWSCSKNCLCRLFNKILSIFVSLWRMFFPKTRRLLTVDEYEKQGIEETKKAIEQLRSFCRSPQANAWKLTSALSDPKRFASFVEDAADHVNEEESRLYELDCTNPGHLSDDSGEDELLYETRYHHLKTPERNVLRDRSFMMNGSMRWNRRPKYVTLDGENEEEDYGETSRRDWDISARSLPLKKSRSTPIKRSKRPGSEYDGLLMPIPPRLLKSEPEQITAFYNLTPQQSAIYEFMRQRGMRRGKDYTGESEQTIKQSVPEECFDEVEFDEDLARLVECNLIHESFLDGYWRTT